MSSKISLKDRFSRFLSECVDHHEQKRFLLAVSGGIDSIVMLELFHASGLSVEIAHCNFGLRDDASDADERFVKEVAASRGLVCYAKRFVTGTVAQEKGVSKQMAARDLRYDWFQELFTDGNFDFLCTAHHRGDNAETVLFNLTKGTGIAGLHGIRPLKDHLVRPLLPFTREEIQKYAEQQGVDWREDASNQSNKYSRNLIRNEVIPSLRQINPSVEKAIWQSSQRIAQVENWLRDEVSNWEKALIKKEGDTTFINTSKLDNHAHRNLILSELIKPLGFSYADIDDIVDQSKVRSGRQFYAAEFELVWDREQMVITPKHSDQVASITIESPGEFFFQGEKFRIEIIPRNDWQLKHSNDVLQADADKIHWPLILRTWREGDTIQPLGMKGRKKVSDILIDEKVPRNLKSKHLIMENKDEIIWVVGLRVSERSKVEDSTKIVLFISRG